jgi:hypothetical protein
VHEEKRQHPRHELYASVELKGGKELLLLTVRNISESGCLLSNDGFDLEEFEIGCDYDMDIYDPDHPDRRVSVKARVVRRPPDGIALSWSAARSIVEVGRLLATLRK